LLGIKEEIAEDTNSGKKFSLATEQKMEFIEEQSNLTDIADEILSNIAEDSSTDDKSQDDFSWFLLKKDPKKPTTNNVKQFIIYVNKMRELQNKINIRN